MTNLHFRRLGAICAALVALASLVYAVAYLFVAPSAQRKSDVDAFFRSYLDHPTGMRIASVCLAVSGILTGVAIVALRDWMGRGQHRLADWATVAGVAGGLFTSAHGLASLVGTDKLAHKYAAGDAATKAAVVVSHSLPSPTDPRGLMTFGLAGLVALAFGVVLLGDHRAMGRLAILYGACLVVLFFSTAIDVNALVLISGGLASVIVGPAWWVRVAATVRSAQSPAPAGGGV